MVKFAIDFQVIHEIRGDEAEITPISFLLKWETFVAIQEGTEMIVELTFVLAGEEVHIVQSLAATLITRVEGKYTLPLEGVYIAVGHFEVDEISMQEAILYYIPV